MSAPMTAGERMKAVSFFDQGWSPDEIASQFNRDRTEGYLKPHNLPTLSPGAVSECINFFKRGTISA